MKRFFFRFGPFLRVVNYVIKHFYLCFCYRNAVDSGLFQQWLKNMQREDLGLLGRGKMSLKNVIIQVRYEMFMLHTDLLLVY